MLRPCFGGRGKISCSTKMNSVCGHIVAVVVAPRGTIGTNLLRTDFLTVGGARLNSARRWGSGEGKWCQFTRMRPFIRTGAIGMHVHAMLEQESAAPLGPVGSEFPATSVVSAAPVVTVQNSDPFDFAAWEREMRDRSPEAMQRRKERQEQREQMEREKRAKELFRRKMQRKQMQLKATQEANAQRMSQVSWPTTEMTVRDIGETSAGSSLEWGSSGATYLPPAVNPKPLGSSTETLGAPPAAAYPSQSSGAPLQSWEYGGNPTAAAYPSQSSGAPSQAWEYGGNPTAAYPSQSSGAPLQAWEYGGNPTAAYPSQSSGAPLQAWEYGGNPTAAYPSQSSGSPLQAWEYGGSPTAAFPPSGSSRDTLLEPPVAAYTPVESQVTMSSSVESSPQWQASGYGSPVQFGPGTNMNEANTLSTPTLVQQQPGSKVQDSYPFPSVTTSNGSSNGVPSTLGDGFPEVVPRRRLTQAEREQEERMKRAKELARRRIERKQRELAQKQKEYAEERERELLENAGGAYQNGGYVAAANPPLAAYPAPVGFPSVASITDGIQQNAADPQYYDSRSMYGQPGYFSRADKDVVSPGGAFLERQNVTQYQPEIIEEELRIWDDMDKLLQVLPEDLREKLLTHPRQAELLEVVLDLGRRPEARFLGGGGEYWREEKITREDLQTTVSGAGVFGGDNRAGIEGTLHRISAIRSRRNDIVGLTCRVGRAVTGQVNMVQDILCSGQSILFLGRPGVGKTTAIREMARVLSDKLHKRVVIVDTSNEIGGDGDVPHPAIGSARRMQVPDPSMQHKVMVEAVENHMPEVVIVDEVGSEADAMACRTIAERGVMLVATAHGLKLENIIKNPTLCDLVGGVQTVILGDLQARSRGSQKSVLERKAPPTFPLLIEMRERDHWVIHQTDKSVDCLLHWTKPIVEIRTRDKNFKVVVSRRYYDGSATSRMDGH